MYRPVPPVPPVPPGGIAKFSYIAGMLVSFAGLALFMYPLVTTIAEGFALSQVPLGEPFTPPNFSRIGRAMPLAFGLALSGGIVVALASAIGARQEAASSVHNYHHGDVFQAPAVKGSGRMTIAGPVATNTAYQSRNVNQVANINIQRVRSEIGSLRAEVVGLGLPQRDLQPILGCLSGAEWELQKERPDTRQVGSYLEEATVLMERAGAFVSAGQVLIPRLVSLAKALGFAGAGILQLLN